MKRWIYMAAVLMAAASLGCQPADPPAATGGSETTTASTSTDASGDYTFVSLSVPNMT